jgi:catechol 2,3-dioxygenase-like lactoylglutathione lyase family enzyme
MEEAMKAVGLNHVSIHARDLDESARFYSEVLGLKPIPTPNFGYPVQWFQLGDRQLHLFQRDTEAPRYHHLALNVDDFEAVYKRAEELGIIEREQGGACREFPDGAVQMYIRDPAGNRVEIDWPDARTLDTRVVKDMVRLEDAVPQTDESRRAKLFIGA